MATQDDTGSETTQGAGRNAWERWFFGGMKGSMPRGPNNPGGERFGGDIPEAPNLSEDPTGITGPGAEEPQTVEDLGQGVVGSAEDAERERLAAAGADKVEADKLAEGVQGDVDAAIEDADAIGDTIEADRLRFEADLADTRGLVDAIPKEVTDEFTRLRDEFGVAADASFDRIDSQREEALADVMQGRSTAMQAAVQGIQGSINSSIAQIQANPNLSQSQKQSMVAQVKLAGASSLAPAIGANILEFNKLSADVATKFGAITGALEGIALQGTGELIGLQGQAFTNAQIAVGQMTTQLLEIDATASIGFTNSQSQLLAARSHAVMTGNDILLRLMPEQETPSLDLTNAAIAAYEIGRDNMFSQWEIDMGTEGFRLQREVVESMVGNPVQNMLFDFLNFVGQFG